MLDRAVGIVAPGTVVWYSSTNEGGCQVADYVSLGKPPPRVARPETRLIGEYVAAMFPGRRVAMGVPLGPEIEGLPTRLTASGRLKVSRPWRPEADALVWLDDALLLIEAKVAEYVSGLAKLPLYRSLVPLTPELAEWASWEVRLRLVVPRAQNWVAAMAAAAGVEIVLYEPAWMVEYWAYRDRYWTAGYRREREGVLELRRQLGVE